MDKYWIWLYVHEFAWPVAIVVTASILAKAYKDKWQVK